MSRSRNRLLRRALSALTLPDLTLSLLLFLTLILAACESAAPLHPTVDPDTLRGSAKDTLPVVDEPLRSCTAMLRIMMSPVVDGAGRPVIGAEVEVSLPDGRAVRVEQEIGFAPGLHTVFYDDLLPLEAEGTRVTARFSKDGKTHSEEYLLGDDDCHFFVLSRPDTVRTGW